MSFAVIVATFGDGWRARGQEAARSAQTQTVDCDVVIVHGLALDEARNLGARRTEADWLVFLDADDRLDPLYIEAMSAVAGFSDQLLQPMTAGFYSDGTVENPVFIPPKASLRDGNWMVIGTAVRREQFLRVGGFRSLPAAEDWDLWIRCWLDGATFAQVPGAVYLVGVNLNSRNSASAATEMAWHDVQRTYWA